MNKVRILVVGVVMISALWIGVSVFNRYLGKSKAAGIPATFVMSADPQELSVGTNGVVNVVIKPADDGTLSRKISGLDLVFKTEGGIQMTEIQAPKPYPSTPGVAVQSNMIQNEVGPNMAHVSYVFINPTLSLPSAVQFQIAFKGVSGGKARIYLDPAESQVVGNVEGSAYDLGAGASVSADVFLKGSTSELTVPVQMDPLRIVASPGETIPISLKVGPPAGDKLISGFTLSISYNDNDLELLDVSDPMELTANGVEAASKFTQLKKETTPGHLLLSYVAILPEAQLPQTALFHLKMRAKRVAKGVFDMSGQITGNIPENEYSINPSMPIYTIDQLPPPTPTPAPPTPTGGPGPTPAPGELTPTPAVPGIPIIKLALLQNQRDNMTSSAVVQLVIDKNGFDPTDTGNTSQMLLSKNKDYSGSVWEQFSALRPWTFDAGDGQKLIYAQFKKSTGEIVEGAYIFILDTTPPTVTMFLQPKLSNTTPQYITIATNDIVDVTGVSSMRVSRQPDFSDNPAWNPFNFRMAYVRPVSPRDSSSPPTANSPTTVNNSLTLYVQYRDRVGNISQIYKDTATWGMVLSPPVSGIVLRPPIGSCMEYNPAQGTTPIRWSWFGYDTVLLQVYDETNNWWTNRWVSGSSYIVDSKDGAIQIPAIPPGRDVFAKYSLDGNTFSALGKVKCAGGTAQPTVTPPLGNDACACGQDNVCGECYFEKYDGV
ncbi:MAG: hypothetical protein Q7S61_05015, partial [bacterium]|nr:hypothetical protein [bacterium]